MKKAEVKEAKEVAAPTHGAVKWVVQRKKPTGQAQLDKCEVLAQTWFYARQNGATQLQSHPEEVEAELAPVVAKQAKKGQKP